MKLNIKGIFKSVVAAGTIIGGAILGNEARKCFTKPIAPDEFDDEDDLFCEDCEKAAEETEPAEEEADDEPAEAED